MKIAEIHNSNVLNTFKINTKSHNDSFGDFLKESISKLEDSQTIVTEKQKEFINGDIEAHELLTVVAESELSLKLATSIAGKLVSSIQEITNMQI